MTKLNPSGEDTPRHICVILAEEIVRILDDSGATEQEKIVAVQIAQSLVSVSRGSLAISSERDPFEPGLSH